MKFRSKNTKRIHETCRERDEVLGKKVTRYTICGRTLDQFTDVTPVSDDEIVTCQHCAQTSRVWGRTRKL